MAQPAAAFTDLLADCTGEAVHLETRDAYGLNDPAFQAWQAGRLKEPDVVALWGPWLDLARAATDRGVRIRRARIVSEPLSDYTRYEYDITADLNLAAGEQVRWLPRRRASDLALPGNDFWLFDNQVVLFNHFTGNGDRDGADTTTDPDIVALCSSAFDATWQRAIPHTDYQPR